MKQLLRFLGKWAIWVHIYLSMAGFTLVLLFAITGITLNHQDFGLAEPTVSTSTIDMPAELASHGSKPEITAYFQGKLGLSSDVSDYHDDPDQIEATFAVPGARTIVTIMRADHTASVESQSRGLLGKIDDLHRGHDGGKVWSWIIDISAALLTISSISGMITLLTLQNRRKTGLIVGVIGLVAIAIVYVAVIPH